MKYHIYGTFSLPNVFSFYYLILSFIKCILKLFIDFFLATLPKDVREALSDCSGMTMI